MKKNYFKILFLGLLAFSTKANAQCSSCTTTITTADTSPHLVSAGTTLCVSASGSLSGLIEVDAGGMLCNSGSITSTNIWLNGGGLTNYGTISTPDILTSSGGSFINYNALTSVHHFQVSTAGSFLNQGIAGIDSLLITDAGSSFTNTAGTLNGIRLAAVSHATITNNTGSDIYENYVGDSSFATFNNNMGNLHIGFDFGNGYNSAFNNMGYMNVARDFGNSTSSTFTTNCMVIVGRDWYNSATINGSTSSCGGFSIASNSLNSGTIGSSTMLLDICDAGHPAGGLDGNTGTIGSATTFCTCTNNCAITTIGIIEPIAASDLIISNIYPNPAVTSMDVELNANKPEMVMVEVYDMMGRKHSAISLKLANGTNKTTLDVSKLAQGTYVLSITDSKQLQTKKLFTVVK